MFSFKVSHISFASSQFSYSLAQLEKLCNRTYYALSYDKWGKGSATEATYALLQYAFLKIGIERVVTVVFPENKASVRVLKKLGFQFEEKVKNLNEEFKEFAGMHSFYITKDVFLKNLTNNR
ncbi:GNAT family N-acetyltransferase [Bacillus wiedmannii]|uniref:GNAT family N-acetyltransferase n=1 Tax=Bacillus wiedmannii TaxID=1890302 RepID=UPI001CBE3DB8|nr:GNAT family protein [Bacillus wiedmannii]